MKKNGIFSGIINAILDPERDILERIYLALTIVTEVTVLVAFLGDLLIAENPYEIAVILGTLVFVPGIMIIALRINRIPMAIKMTIIAQVFFILPALYFFGGGVEGGGVLWIIFTFTYTGLVLSGTWRIVVFISIVLLSLICYGTEYYYPELVYRHSRGSFLVDSFFSIILVGIICFAMTWLQNRFFMEQNDKAKKAAEKAEELTRAQNRFFSSMSHEIRTPINSILGLNELIMRDQSASDEILKEASGINGSGKMLLALINDILDFSKMEAGGMDIVPVDYRIGDLFSEIVNMIWQKANDKGLKLNVTIDPTVPSVLYGDEVRVKQIILNLLNNAVKYTSEGHIELHLESEIKGENKVELTISVSDTGMGIKKEVIPYLFDAFKRVDEERNRHIEGTGLGLSIVKQLVELMGGTVTVNSIYGEGTTFTVVLVQGISDHSVIGDINIHNQSFVKRNAYESSFRAPDARILIVDDNELNLEVECRLLSETGMTIDKAYSGKEALMLDLKHRYDVIFMDHLMPEMDGIECLGNLRNHAGGLNLTTPVIALTANAGSENRELYSRSGFEGYLIKPVSGEFLENAIMKYLPADKLILNNNKIMSMKEDINASAGFFGKLPVVITSSSTCDLPDSIIKRLHIPIIPFMIKTEEGVFKDGVQMGADELVRYMSTGKSVESVPPNESNYTDFFAAQLKRAHHLIHIAITSSMSEEYRIASDAAASFDNVTVVNSGCISSATGILVLIAGRLAQASDSVEEILEQLENIKARLQCSFVIDTTEYMVKRGYVSSSVDRFARALSLHPCVRIKDDRSYISKIWIGNSKRAYKKYIASAFPVDVIPDPEVVFITHASLPIETLLWIKEEISKIAFFENVVFKQASAAISSNCGPGAVGILYFIKSNKSYNLSSYFTADNLGNYEKTNDEPLESADINKQKKMPGIDMDAAVKNSGSKEALNSVMEMFYNSIDDKALELRKLWSEGDIKNYTIKIHALKSSCKLIGALETSRKAQLLENAGKEEDKEYIQEHNDEFIKEFTLLKEPLSKYLAKNEPADALQPKQAADDEKMKDIYERVLEGASQMDCDAIENALNELKEYDIPESEKEKLEELKKKADEFDYDGIVELLR